MNTCNRNWLVNINCKKLYFTGENSSQQFLNFGENCLEIKTSNYHTCLEISHMYTLYEGINFLSGKKKLYHELRREILSVRRKVHKLILFYKIEIVLTPPYPKDLL